LIRTKDDIEFHQLGYGGRSVPAVNVKIRDSLQDGFKKFQEYEPNANPHFTLEWIESHVSEDTLQAILWNACETGWESLQEYAEEIFGKTVKVYSEGRQGGWAYIHGINDDTSDWDAIDLARWRKFAKQARDEADDIMYRVVDSVYINQFDDWVRA
jgi:hypothetical protein